MNNIDLHPSNNKDNIIWDGHSCPSYHNENLLNQLHRYKKVGYNVVTLNVGFDVSTFEEILQTVKKITNWISLNHEEYHLITKFEDIAFCKLSNKLGIIYDLEGCSSLLGNLRLLDTLYNIGIRQLAPTYNKSNMYGGGCLDEHDKGLTSQGKLLIQRCLELGIVVDCSHVGLQTSLDIMSLSNKPIVFSHSNPKKVYRHPRNITDEQIRSCASKNGVVGINGISIFLDHHDLSTTKIVEHIDYVTQLVGCDNVGIGLDYIFDTNEAESLVTTNPNNFPTSLGYRDVKTSQPEVILEIIEKLDKLNYSSDSIDKILGLNFLRVANSVWSDRE